MTQEKYVEDEVLQVEEKHRVSNEGDMPPTKETFPHFPNKPDAVTKELADYLWHDMGIDVENHDIEVVKNE